MSKKRTEKHAPKIPPLPVNDSVLKYTLILVKLPNKLYCLAYKWNRENARFVSLNEKKLGDKAEWIIFRLVLGFVTLHTMAMILQFAHAIATSEERQLIQMLMGLMTIIAMSGCTFGRWNYSAKALSFTNGINNLNAFLSKHKYGTDFKPVGFKHDVLVFFVLGMISNILAIPLIAGVAGYLFPCVSSILGYFLLDECKPNVEPSLVANENQCVIRIVLVLLHSLTTLLICAGGFVDLVFGLMEFSYFLGKSLDIYNSSVMDAVTQTEAATEESFANLERRIAEYRKIQMIASLYNEINQNFLIVGYAMMLISFQILSLFVCISLSDKIPGLFTLLFLVCAINLVPITIFTFSYVADIYGSYENTKQGMYDAQRQMRMSVIFTSKYQKRVFLCSNRFFKSCRVVRAEFGPFYFIDSKTPLEFESFVIDQTVSFLLMK